MSRTQFREQCVERDDGQCLVPWCPNPVTVDPDGPGEVHHILDKGLWPNDGYIEDNGACVCNDHHRMAEQNEIPPAAFWRWADIDPVPIPTGLHDVQGTADVAWVETDQTLASTALGIDKWGERFDTPPHGDLRDYHKYPSTRHLLPVYWHSDIGTAAMRTGRDDTGLTSVESFLDIPLVTTIKMDGCLPYNQNIITKEHGQIPIGTIVNQEKDVKVLSFNEDTGVKEYKEVTNYFKNGKTENWKRINHEKIGQSERIVATPNHEIYTCEGKKTVSEISVGDELKMSKPNLTTQQEDMIVGSLLGDGSLGNVDQPNPIFEEVHGQNQHEYVDWKVDVLGEIISNTNTYMSAYSDQYDPTEKKSFHTVTLPSLNLFREMVVDGGGRSVPDWLELNEKSIAVWFCDDGNTKYSDVQRPRASFNTHCFTERGCEKLLSLLNEYGICGSINDNGNGPRIDLTTDSSKKLYELISQYVPSCMGYKIPDKFWTEKCNWDDENQQYEYAKVESISDTNTHSPVKFDIEVKDNHNYFTSEVLVSNSNAMLVADHEEPVRARNGRDAEHESFDHLKQEYWDRNVYENLPEHLQVFGENLYAKHSIHYGCPHDGCGGCDSRNRGPAVRDVFVVFGVYDTRYDLWLSWPETEDVAEQIGFPTAFVYDKPDLSLDGMRASGLSEEHQFIEKYTPVGKSVVKQGHEGFIVRSMYPLHYGQFERKLGKYVRPNHVTTDEHWSHQQTTRNRIEPGDMP